MTDQSASSKIPLTTFTMPVKTIKRCMYAVGVLFFLLFVGVLIDEVSIIKVIVSAMGAAVLALLSYLLFMIPGKIVSVMRSKQILAAKKQHASS